MTNLSIDTDQKTDIDYDDINNEPPLSPPPVHAIYFPETYHYAGTPQDNSHHHPVREYSHSIRRFIFALAKKTLLALLRNNNILLIANFLNKVWKQRIFAIRSFNTAFYFIQQNGYKQTLFYVIHFFKHQISDYLVKQKIVSSKVASHSLTTVTRHSLRNPTKSFLFVTALLKHTPALTMKLISKATKSVGGLDSILLAFSVIVLTKSIQNSNTIF